MSLKGDILCCLKTTLWTRKSLSLVNWFDVFLEVTFIFSLEAAKWTCKCLPFMDWFYVSLEISLSGGVLATKSTFEQFLHLWDQQLETFEKFWSTSKYIHYQNKRKCTLLSMVRRSIIFSSSPDTRRMWSQKSPSETYRMEALRGRWVNNCYFDPYYLLTPSVLYSS